MINFKNGFKWILFLVKKVVYQGLEKNNYEVRLAWRKCLHAVQNVHDAEG